ncbi:hypothetical protein [Streptomyces sp. NPDC008150]
MASDNVVLRPAYRRRPAVSYRPRSSDRGAVGVPVMAPMTASVVTRTYW